MLGRAAQFDTSTLSEQAKEILFEAAADPSGVIMKLAFIGGRFIQTNGKKFGESKDRRSEARWEHGLEQLISEGLVKERGHKGEIFEVTARGYDLADVVRSERL